MCVSETVDNAIFEFREKKSVVMGGSVAKHVEKRAYFSTRRKINVSSNGIIKILYICNELIKKNNNECLKVYVKSLEVANQQSSSKTQKN
jgi:uncharacterized membrane protein